MAREFLNPWGSTAQQYWKVALVLGSCLSKANNDCACSSAGMQKKASWRSNTENLPKFPGTAVYGLVYGLGDVLNYIIDSSEVLYKSVFIHVQLNWQNGGIIFDVAL